MTQALYNRIDAIESFAADVAHELKNPLTSLRSAVETLPRVKAGPSRDRLLEIMQHDVRRLDRLISDISDASRLDAELARDDAGPVDVAALLRAVVVDGRRIRRAATASRCGSRSKRQTEDEDPGLCRARPRFAAGAGGHQSHRQRLLVLASRAARCAFASSGRAASRRRKASRAAIEIVVTVDDDGPGIPPHALERIFERFYTDRPDQGFGQNSGLGLSISRQIVRGARRADLGENRPFRARRGAPPNDARNADACATARARASSSPAGDRAVSVDAPTAAGRASTRRRSSSARRGS